ncbi:MAG: family 78 glycoside hydrolase catalytic domain, partial [Clostridia bacterium]
MPGLTCRIVPHALQVNGDPAPLGLDDPAPEFSWKLRGRGVQTAYRIQIARTDGAVRPSTIYDSGPVSSSATVSVRCPGLPLQAHASYRWRVQVRDQNGSWGGFRSARLETAFLGRTGFVGRFITAPAHPVGVPDAPSACRELKPPRYLIHRFCLPAPPLRARLHATAAGVYQPYVNGHRVGGAELAPGWTDYNRRFRYQTYDVTAEVGQGENVLGLLVGDGWYAGYVGFGRQRAHYGQDPAVWAELHVWLSDGTKVVVATDVDWRTTTGPILYSDLLMGEAYDARRESPGWCSPGSQVPDGGPVRLSAIAADHLQADRTPPARIWQTRDPVSTDEVDPGVYVLDFGQNLVGRPLLDTRCFTGRIRMRFGEVRDRDGRLYTDNLREAAQTDLYHGHPGTQTPYRPAFTYHGFRYMDRYMEITGTDSPPPAGSVRAEVIAGAQPDTGWASSPEPLVAQLVSNIRWSQRGNLLFVPTDCPQRDERLGWLGDAQVFVETAAWNQDVRGFFYDWLNSVEDAQSPAGAFSDVAPRLVDLSDGAPGWADAGILVPWTLYRMYGERRLLERHYPAMRRYLVWLCEHNPDGLWLHQRGNDFGDWLAVGAETPKDLIATAFFAEDCRILSEVATLIGEAADARGFRTLRERVRNAYRTAFIKRDGEVLGDTQTGYVLTLAFGLAAEPDRPAVARRLRDNLHAHGDLLTTGFLGLPHLLPVLSDTGFDDVAWGLLRETRFPSWGYEIGHGATTIWERWDGWTEQRGFQTPEMNSFNHYAFGAVGA